MIVDGACVGGSTFSGARVIVGWVSTDMTIDVDVVTEVSIAVVEVVVDAGGSEVLFEMEIGTELSTSMATTSAGEEPHDTHINIENATVGPIMCRSRGVICRD